MPISKKLDIFGVEFDSLSELCRVLGYAKPVSKSSIDANYQGRINRLAEVRLHLDGLADDEKTRLVQKAKEDYYNRTRGAVRKTPAGYSVLALQSAIRLAVSHCSDADLQTACTIAGGRLNPDNLKAGLKAYAENLDLDEGYMALIKF